MSRAPCRGSSADSLIEAEPQILGSEGVEAGLVAVENKNQETWPLLSPVVLFKPTGRF
jgi:hypothetical protein